MNDYSRIPVAMQREKRWVCWAKGSKTPKNAYTGGNAMSNKSETWATFHEALAACGKYGFVGIGFMFGGGWSGIDLDHCEKDITAYQSAERGGIVWEILHTIDKSPCKVYAEISPSGTGVHIIGRGALPAGGRKKGNVEMYNDGRYFRLTCNFVDDTHTDIDGDCSAALNQIHTKYLAEKPDNKRIQSTHNQSWGTPTRIDFDTMLEKIYASKQGGIFHQLFNKGDISGYKSQSEADLALCNILAFWLGNDAAAIDAAYRQSALMQVRGKKWDRKQVGTTYGAITIQKAIDGTLNTYQQHKEERPHGASVGDPAGGTLASMGYSVRVKNNTEAVVKCNRNLKLYVQRNSEILHNVRWNDFADYAEIQRSGKWERLTDADLLQIATKIEEHARQRSDGLQVIQSWSINKNNVLDIITEFAERVNPVKAYFEGLQWDGVERIPTLFHDVLGADKNEYTAAAAKLFLLGIFSRVYVPGCKFDYMVVLQGAQGLGKSAFFKALAINDDWYGSIGAEHMRDTKRLGEDSAGRLILEYEELNGIRKTDNEALKATITRTNDIYRKSYGTISESHKRKFVLVGTTNNGQYLTDPTGNRRYLPVPVTKKGFLDANTVNQIWAETMHIYKAGGFNLYFDDTTDKAADEYREQATSLISDDYSEKIDGFVNMPTPGIDSAPMQFIQWIDVYTALGDVFKGMTNTQAKRIICEALERMGWERTRKRTENSNNAVWGYSRPKS